MKETSLPLRHFVFQSLVFCIVSNGVNGSTMLTLFDANVDSVGVVTPDAGDQTFNEVAFLQDFPSLGPVSSVRLDYSNDQRLYAVIDNESIIYEIDTQTGALAGTFDVGVPLEGVAALDGGQLFVNWEHNGIISVDFDAQTSDVVATYSHPIDIDGIDFDGLGNLIGSDINESGSLYEIGLDGSGISLLGHFPNISAGDITYSIEDDRMLFLAQDTQQLWSLEMIGGSPSGSLTYLKDIPAPGRALGLAYIPEPATIVLISPMVFSSIFRRKRG